MLQVGDGVNIMRALFQPVAAVEVGTDAYVQCVACKLANMINMIQ